MPSGWANVTHIFGWFSFFVTIWSTISLSVLIEKKSRKEFGTYKMFMRIYCFYAMAFGIIDWLVQPIAVVDIHGFGYIFYSENRLFDMGYTASHLAQILYCGCFIASSSFLSLNFIYRYASTCHKHYMRFFQGRYLIIWFFYCAIPFAVWSITVYLVMNPTPERTAHFNVSTVLMEQVDISDRAYVGVTCRHVSNSSDHSFGDIEWPTMSAFLGLIGFQGFFYGTSLFCGIQTYRGNLRLFKAAQLSPHLYKIQAQLFKSLVVQATIPLVSVYVPAAIMITGSMLGVYVGRVGPWVVISISSYPPLDTLVFLLSIRDYRNALFCNMPTNSQYGSVNNSVHQILRPRSAKVSDASPQMLGTAS